MTSIKYALGLLVLVAFTTGCQPAKKSNTRERVNRGRDAGSGQLNAQTGAYTSNGTSSAQKLWGEVISSQGDQYFNQVLKYFTTPSLQSLPADDQLGFVSSQSGQRTGVRFYGNAVTTGTSGGSVRTFDPQSMLIHVEIYDDRTGQPRADGSARPPVVVEIGAGTSGFVSARGEMNGSQINLIFQDGYGAIQLQGAISGQYFQGNMGFADSSTGGQMRQLGEFRVPTCGFFQCQ